MPLKPDAQCTLGFLLWSWHSLSCSCGNALYPQMLYFPFPVPTSLHSTLRATLPPTCACPVSQPRQVDEMYVFTIPVAGRVS